MALPDPRRWLAQQRAKEQREEQKKREKEKSQKVYIRPPVPPPEIIRLHTPFSYKGCNVFTISRKEVLISNSDKTFLSITKTPTGCNIYLLGKLINSISIDYESLDEKSIRNIIDHAFSIA